MPRLRSMPMMLSTLLLTLALLTSPPASAESADGAEEVEVVHAFTGRSDPGSLRDNAEARGVEWPPERFWIEIDKSERRLTAWSGPVALKHYRVGLADGEGDKVRQGDLKTPNGLFRVVTRNHRSNFHLFLGLSYPDAQDAERGRASGLVTEAQAQKIIEADAAGRLPPWGTALGGAIGIHGGGGSADWTLGCIAVEDAEIEELWEVAPYRTRVLIQE